MEQNIWSTIKNESKLLKIIDFSTLRGKELTDTHISVGLDNGLLIGVIIEIIAGIAAGMIGELY